MRGIILFLQEEHKKHEKTKNEAFPFQLGMAAKIDDQTQFQTGCLYYHRKTAAYGSG
jgi:hypothetical protein